MTWMTQPSFKTGVDSYNATDMIFEYDLCMFIATYIHTYVHTIKKKY